MMAVPTKKQNTIPHVPLEFGFCEVDKYNVTFLFVCLFVCLYVSFLLSFIEFITLNVTLQFDVSCEVVTHRSFSLCCCINRVSVRGVLLRLPPYLSRRAFDSEGDHKLGSRSSCISVDVGSPCSEMFAMHIATDIFYRFMLAFINCHYNCC